MLASVARSLRPGTPTGGSYWALWLNCRRRFYHERIEHLSLVEREDRQPRGWTTNGGGLLGGSLLHATLAAFYELVRTSIDGQRRPELDLVRPEFELARDYLEADPKTEQVVWSTFSRFANVTAERLLTGAWRVIGVEVPLRVIYPNGAQLTARVDCLFEHLTSKEVIYVDWKLKSNDAGGNVEYRRRMSGAVTTTLLAARDGSVWAEEGCYAPGDGPDPGSSLSNHDHVFICEVLTKNDPSMLRGGSVTHPAWLLNRYRDRIQAAHAEMVQLHGGSVEVYPCDGLVNGSCRGFGDRCPYMDLCFSGGSAIGLYEQVVP
jgi:hypothetical protein